jgi:hypothetical protein
MTGASKKFIVFRALCQRPGEGCSYSEQETWDIKEDFVMSKRRFYFRRFRSANGFGLVLFRPERLNPYFVLSLRPRQRRFLLRLPRHLVGLSWWPPRFWNAAALLAEKDKAATAT